MESNESTIYGKNQYDFYPLISGPFSFSEIMKAKRSKCSLDFSLGLFSQALACESRMEFDLKRQVGQLSLDSQAKAQCRQKKKFL